MARAGRPSLSPTSLVLVRDFIERAPSLSNREVARRASEAGLRVSFETVRKIRLGTYDAGQLDAPIRCPGCGGLVLVLPCQACRARATIERERKLQVRAASLGKGEPRRPRGRMAS